MVECLESVVFSVIVVYLFCHPPSPGSVGQSLGEVVEPGLGHRQRREHLSLLEAQRPLEVLRLLDVVFFFDAL